jgi:flagellar basal body-associated protein FliL
MSDEENVEEGQQPEKRSKLPLILMLVGGLVVGGGGAASYFMFLAPKEEVQKTDQSQDEIDKEKLAARKPVFVVVDRVSAPMISKDNVVVGHVSMYVRLQVKNDDDLDWVRDRLPMVRHAINLSVAKDGVSFPESPFTVDYDGTAKRIAEGVRAYLQTDKILAAHIKEAVRL